MNETEGHGSETLRRTPHAPTGRTPRPRQSTWWAAPFAILAVAILLGSAGIALLRPSTVEKEWSAISLSLGGTPISQQLEVKFSRVAYIDQPAEFNTTAFGSTAKFVLHGAWLENSSGYGIIQFNNTTGQTAVASWPLGSVLGANVSYAFVDQRVALNGTTGQWVLELSEAGNVTALPPTTGNVSNSSAGAAQNAVWVTATANATSGLYAMSVGDWEVVPGGHQTLKTVAFPVADDVQALKFFEVYLYVQKTETVVSLVNTTNAAVVASKTIHPVLDHNLSKLGYLSDLVTAGSGTYGAMIVDDTFFVDHNAFTGVPSFSGTTDLRPMIAGDLAPLAVTPADPSVQSGNLTQTPASSQSWSSVKGGLASFPAVLNSSDPASMTSSLVPGRWVVNKTNGFTSAPPAQSLATLRSANEARGLTQTATLYLTSWSPETIETQIEGFLQGYVSAQTGIPAADVEIQEYLVSDIKVVTTFSSSAAQTIHDYLANAIPAFLSKDNLSLVNTTTGAIQAGAAIGQFMDLATGAIHAPKVTSWGAVFDPVNGKTYASPEAAGFPVGSGITASGAIFVPQARFLGWTAAGLPEYSTELGGCFIVCISNPLSGAASAVSSFFGSAASSVANAAQTVTSTVDQAVIKPASGTLSSGMSTLSADVSKATSSVMPFFGGTVANVGTDISGTLTHTLGSVGSGLASGASAAAGALLSGVDSFSNGVYHLGSSAAALGNATVNALSKAGSTVVNTLGQAVNTGAAVLTPFFSSVANLPGSIAGAAVNAGKSLASLGGSIASAGMNALDTVGHAIVNAGGSVIGALSGAWHDVTNFFGQLGGAVMDALNAPGQLLSALNPVNWFTGLGGTIGTTLEYVVIAIVVVLVVVLLLVIFVVRPHQKRKDGGRARHEGDGKEERKGTEERSSYRRKGR